MECLEGLELPVIAAFEVQASQQIPPETRVLVEPGGEGCRVPAL